VAVTIDDHRSAARYFVGALPASNHEISKSFNRDTALPSAKLPAPFFRQERVEQEGRRWPIFRA
jgi:hypothetical protein